MNKVLCSLVVIFCLCLVLFAQVVNFDEFFVDSTMRIDYFHIGDARKEFATIDHVYQQGIWAGSKLNLIDDFNNGRYYAKIFDQTSGKLIFSKGFDSYLAEYKTTHQALNGIKRTFHESVLIPFPKRKIKFTLEVRDRNNDLKSFFSQEIDPDSVSIIKEGLDKQVKVFEIQTSGDPHKKVDVAFIAEGYTSQQEDKLKADMKRFVQAFLSLEPYQTLKKNFNFYGVFKPSDEEGCDEPRRGVFKNTAVDTTFNSLGSERYLLTENNKSLRDIAAHVPYDALVIMINHSRYGGGGIYNLYCTFTTDSQWRNYLLLHEFGHSFTGLGDEYYTSSVAYNDFFPKGIEPAEPNITALLDPENLKWKLFLTEGVEIPTPWEKEEYDKMDMAYQKIRGQINEKIARMKREGAPEVEIMKSEQESERLSREHAQKMDDYLANSKYRNTVGAFEGAGYSAQGLFRPMLDCIMFTKGDKPFCKVCKQAVIRVIKHYIE